MAFLAMLALLPGLAGSLAPPAPVHLPPAPESSIAPITFSIPRYALTPLERETVAACLVLEAASQGELGLRGVMAVIRNRARGQPELFAPTVLRRKQFSSFNQVTAGRKPLAQAIARAKRDRTWRRALAIVDQAVQSSWYDPTGGATHYTVSSEHNQWTRKLERTVIIGAHAFYR